MSRSTNPFDFEDDVDDETFLKNSRVDTSFNGQLQEYADRRRAIEERTITSTEKSISVLRDSEQIGIATAEELARQREKLEKTDRQLDEINATLRYSQKHINGIKSVFSSLKNYVSGRRDGAPKPDVTPHSLERDFEEKLSTYDRFENHPSTRLRNVDYSSPSSGSSGGSKDFSARLDANLEEMSSNITRLKGLAADLGTEIESQNDLISNINDKTEIADLSIKRQNKDMLKLMKK